MSGESKAPDLTTPLDVLQGWLTEAFEKGWALGQTSVDLRILWQLNEDGTLKPKLMTTPAGEVSPPNPRLGVTTSFGAGGAASAFGTAGGVGRKP